MSKWYELAKRLSRERAAQDDLFDTQRRKHDAILHDDNAGDIPQVDSPRGGTEIETSRAPNPLPPGIIRIAINFPRPAVVIFGWGVVLATTLAAMAIGYALAYLFLSVWPEGIGR